MIIVLYSGRWGSVSLPGWAHLGQVAQGPPSDNADYYRQFIAFLLVLQWVSTDLKMMLLVLSLDRDKRALHVTHADINARPGSFS